MSFTTCLKTICTWLCFLLFHLSAVSFFNGRYHRCSSGNLLIVTWIARSLKETSFIMWEVSCRQHLHLQVLRSWYRNNLQSRNYLYLRGFVKMNASFQSSFFRLSNSTPKELEKTYGCSELFILLLYRQSCSIAVLKYSCQRFSNYSCIFLGMKFHKTFQV